MENIDNKSKKRIVFIILAFILVLLGTTFAWITWRSSDNNSVNITVGSLVSFSFSEGNSINTSSLAPVLGYENQTTTLVPQINFTSINTSGEEKKVKMYLSISSIDNNLKNSTLKYVLLKSTDGTTYTQLSTGDFTSAASGSNLTIYTNFLVPANTTYYRFLIYLDGEEENSYNMQNTGLSATLNVEEYIPPFGTDSWETIKANITAGTTSDYSVGDTKCIALDGFTTTNSNGCSSGQFKVRIANKSTPSDCSGSDYSQTACGFVIEFVDIISKHVMNPSTETDEYGTNVGSWPATSMRTYVNSDIYNALPSALQSVIATTKVVTGYGSSDSSLFTSNDKIYLLSPYEVGNYSGSYDTGKDKTRQLDYYSGAGVTTSSYSGAIKQYNGSNTYWWLRAPNSINSNTFFSVGSDGDWSNTNANSEYGVAPAFRIVP